MEIGSFIEMQFEQGKEYYSGDNVIRLNSGRAGIYHAIRSLDCDTVWLPFYQCETVREFLNQKKRKIKYYKIDQNYNPINVNISPSEAIVLVNYFGIMKLQRMQDLASNYQNVIIDNCQAFFATPIAGCMNVYSARKFIGVPDGAYVVGEKLLKKDIYERDYSSDTSLFLLKRLEYGCEGETYQEREKNEERINQSDIKLMSVLTQRILDGTNYDFIMKKRKENFEMADELLGNMNLIDVNQYFDNTCVPMIYPFVVERDDLLPKLLENKIFQGHWWSYLLKETEQQDHEYWLSRYMIPISIDQRYSRKELVYTKNIISEFLNEKED